MPWYVTTLFISQPLHFGDYGGMPLKILWALLDVLTIIVLGTGVYLWLRRRKAGVSVDRAVAQGSAANTPLTSSRDGWCEKTPNAWADFRGTDRCRSAERRRPGCGSDRRWLVGRLVVALTNPAGPAVFFLCRAAKPRSAH